MDSPIAARTNGFSGYFNIVEDDDMALVGNTSVGPTGSSEFQSGTYFNTSLFSSEILGQLAMRRVASSVGPGSTIGPHAF